MEKRGGGINRNTRHRAGMPKGDMYMFNGEITYGEIGQDGNA